MKSNVAKHVVVTGLLATDNPYPGLGIARCLRLSPEFTGTISAFVFEPLSNGVFDGGIIDRAFIVPYPAAGCDVLFERIRCIHEHRPIDVILPSLDSEVSLYAELAGPLRNLGIGTLLPPPSQVKLRAKNLLYEFGLEEGIRVPKTLLLNNIEELRPKVREAGIPFLLKGILNDARICASVEEGERCYEELYALWGYPILLQSFVAGEEFDVIALADNSAEMVGAVAMKKFGLTDKGKAFAGLTVEDDGLLRLTAEILRKLRWTGPIECEFIRDRAGDLYLMEVNSRFPSWLYLSAAAGQNLPLAAVRLAAGLPAEPMRRYAAGKLFIRTVADRIVDAEPLLALAAAGEMRV